MLLFLPFFFFFFNDTATTEIYTLSLHDALPILRSAISAFFSASTHLKKCWRSADEIAALRSEEHTSELQSQFHLVCRLLLEKKKKKKKNIQLTLKPFFHFFFYNIRKYTHQHHVQ